MEEYTLESFIENYLNDKKVFGEDTKYIYEEIFSAILEEDVDLTSFDNNIEEVLTSVKYDIIEDLQENETLTEEEVTEDTKMLLELAPMDIAKWYNQIRNTPADPTKTLFAKAPDMTAWASQVGPKGMEKLANKLTANGGISGIFGKLKNNLEANGGIGGIFGKLKNKISSFIGGLKGKSFKEILNNGLAWIQNPANLTAALGTTGGIIIIGLILKALKKRKKLKEYKKLQQLTKAGLMREEFENEFSFDDGIKNYAKAKNKVLVECRTNRALYNALYKEEVKIEKQNYFDY